MPPKLLRGHPILLRDPRVARRDISGRQPDTRADFTLGREMKSPAMVPMTEKATLCLALSPPCRLRARGTPARGLTAEWPKQSRPQGVLEA
jgi:hypothetical protein